MGGHESQISPIPPERYGDRFVKFICGITMSRERAENVRLSQTLQDMIGIQSPSEIGGTINDSRLGGVNIQPDNSNPEGTDKVMEGAMREAERSKRHGANELGIPDRSITAYRDGDHGGDGSTLPVIGEAAEIASNASRTPSRMTPTPTPSHDSVPNRLSVLGNANMPSDTVGEIPPPTPPKTDSTLDMSPRRESWGGEPPPTPPKDDRSRGRFLEKDLPLPPVASHALSASPSRMEERELQGARRQAYQ